MSTWRADETGAATLLAVTLSALLIAVAVAVAAMGGLLVSQRKAAASADLAALAGATALQHGRSGCSAARRTAARNGATLAACSVRAEDVLVEVTLAATTLLDQRVSIRATARAGPVGD